MDIIRNLKIDCVSRLAPTPARRLRPEASVHAAVELMRREGFGCVLIIDDDNQLAGLFTERDLLTRVLTTGRPLTTPLHEVMTPDPVTVLAQESIRTALRRMLDGGYRHLPVVHPDNRPLGVLSVKRVVHYLVEHFPATVYNLPPNPSAVPRQREGA